jgi:hypothetical protein
MGIMLISVLIIYGYRHFNFVQQQWRRSVQLAPIYLTFYQPQMRRFYYNLFQIASNTITLGHTPPCCHAVAK